MNRFYKIIPILILILGLVVFISLGGQKYLSLEALKMNYEKLILFTENNFFISTVIFAFAYIIVVAFSIPGATVMTLLGGFLFGLWFGSILVVISATIGATLVFLAVKTALADTLKNKASGSIEKMRSGFKEGAFNYLMVLRLIPIFPFFVINIAAGVLGVRLKDFILGTFLGIIPGTVIYVWVGTGLSYAISQGEDLNLGIIFQPQFILPILALAILSIVPILLKKFKKKDL